MPQVGPDTVPKRPVLGVKPIGQHAAEPSSHFPTRWVEGQGWTPRAIPGVASSGRSAALRPHMRTNRDDPMNYQDHATHITRRLVGMIQTANPWPMGHGLAHP